MFTGDHLAYSASKKALDGFKWVHMTMLWKIDESEEETERESKRRRRRRGEKEKKRGKGGEKERVGEKYKRETGREGIGEWERWGRSKVR